MEYEIKFLKEIPFVSSILAHWAYQNWYLDSKIDLKTVICDYSKRDNSDVLPVTFVAVLKNNFPIGMISLKKSDLQSRPDLSPWLSALYVMPECRKQGVAENLINYLLKFCRNNDINRVHLFIDKKNEKYLENYYSLRGWKINSEAINHKNEMVRIFYYDIKYFTKNDSGN